MSKLLSNETFTQKSSSNEGSSSYDLRGRNFFATSYAQRNSVYSFRYSMYSQKNNRYFIPQAVGEVAGEKMLVDPIDDNSTLIYSVNGDRITGTISICFDPFPAFLKKRLQLDDIDHTLATQATTRLAYVSRLVVDPSDAAHHETAIRLMDDAYWVCVDADVKIAFAHGVKATTRYFTRWGFLPYGKPFKREYPRTQYLLASAPGNMDLMKEVDSPLVLDSRWRQAKKQTLKVFSDITGWNT